MSESTPTDAELVARVRRAIAELVEAVGAAEDAGITIEPPSVMDREQLAMLVSAYRRVEIE